jgi:hypothetical protein
MKTKISSWILAEYVGVGIAVDGKQLDTWIKDLTVTLSQIHDKDLFDKRIALSENQHISVLLYRSGTVEVHINVEGKLSTYESWENPNYIVKSKIGTEITTIGHTVLLPTLSGDVSDDNIYIINQAIIDGLDGGTIEQDGSSFDWEKEACVSVSENIMKDYRTWWTNEGSGLMPFSTEDQEEFIHRVSGIAWSNGSYKTSENAYLLEKVKILEENISVNFEHEDEFYSIWWSDGNDGYMVEVFNPSELNIGEELESDRGGLCTGSAKDAVFMFMGES